MLTQAFSWLTATIKMCFFVKRTTKHNKRGVNQGGVRKKSRTRMVCFPKSVKNDTHPPDFFLFLDFFRQIFGHPPQFFPLFSSYKQNSATPTQFFTVILAQTGRNYGGMPAVDVFHPTLAYFSRCTTPRFGIGI